MLSKGQPCEAIARRKLCKPSKGSQMDPASISLFLKTDLFMCLFERQSNRERSLTHLFISQNATTARSGPGQIQESITPTWSFTWVAGAQELGHLLVPSRKPQCQPQPGKSFSISFTHPLNTWWTFARWIHEWKGKSQKKDDDFGFWKYAVGSPHGRKKE